MDLFGNDDAPASGKILIEVPPCFVLHEEDAETEEPDLIHYFEGLIHGALGAALDLDLEDDRAQVDSVKVEGVNDTGDAIQVDYVVSLSAYYACADQNYAHDDHRYMTGTRCGRQWVFTKHVSPVRQAPNEEL